MTHNGEQAFDYNDSESFQLPQQSETLTRSFIVSNNMQVSRHPSNSSSSYIKDNTRIMGLSMKKLSIGSIIKTKLLEMEKKQMIEGNTLSQITSSVSLLLNNFGKDISMNVQKILKEYNYNEDIHKRFSQQIFSIVKKQINNKSIDSNLQDDCNNFAKTLNLNRLFLNSQIKKQDDESKKMLRQKIINNQIYIILCQYGENIYEIEYNFVLTFFDQFFDRLNLKAFQEVLEKLINDPYYIWTDRNDLSPKQIEDLIQSLWLQQMNPLNDLKRAHKYCQTSKRKKELDIRKIQDYLIIEKRFDFNRQELEQITTALNQYNFQKIFDEIKYIKYQRSDVYTFIEKNCKHYLNEKGKNQQDCIIQITQKYLIMLRNQMFEMCSNGKFHIKNWEKIEYCIMNDTICQILKYFEEETNYYQLKNWVLENFSIYYEKVFPHKNVSESVERELIGCFIETSATQKYKESVELVSLLLEAPYLEVIKSSDLLSISKVKLLASKLENSSVFKDYSNRYKEDSSYYSCKAQSQIKKIIDSEHFQLTIRQKNTLSEAFFNKPQASTIYESDNICNNYKKAIFKNLLQSQQIREYIASHQRITRIQKIMKVKAALQEIIKDGNDFENIVDYFLINGEMLFSNDDKLTVQLEPQYREILSNIKTKMTVEERRKLKELQSQKTFIDLKEDLPEISKIYFVQSKIRLKYTLKGFINKNDSLTTENKTVLENILLDIIEKGNLRQIDENSKLKDSNYQQVITQIKNNTKFKLFSNGLTRRQSNKVKYAQINLKNKIKSMYDDEQFIEFSADQKNKIIDLSVKNLDLSRPIQLDFLNKSCNQYIKAFIQNSQEFKLFEESKQVSNNISSQYKIANNSPSSNDKVDRNITKRPPPPPMRNSEKKIQEPAPIPQIIYRSPEPVSISIKVQQSENIDNFQSPRMIEQQNSQRKQQPPVENQNQALIIQEIIKKWDERLKSWDKYEKGPLKKEKQAHQNSDEFIFKLICAHPWTEASFDFFKLPTRSFLKNRITGELKELCLLHNNDIQEDLKVLREK